MFSDFFWGGGHLRIIVQYWNVVDCSGRTLNWFMPNPFKDIVVNRQVYYNINNIKTVKIIKNKRKRLWNIENLFPSKIYWLDKHSASLDVFKDFKCFYDPFWNVYWSGPSESYCAWNWNLKYCFPPKAEPPTAFWLPELISQKQGNKTNTKIWKRRKHSGNRLNLGQIGWIPLHFNWNWSVHCNYNWNMQKNH